EERAKERAEAEPEADDKPATTLQLTLADGSRRPLDEARVARIVEEACAGLADVDPARVLAGVQRNIYDGVSEAELGQALVMAVRPLIEHDPDYSQVAARLLLDAIRREALSFVHGARREATQAEMGEVYADYFPAYIEKG